MSNFREAGGNVEAFPEPAKPPPTARPSRLLANIYHDIGLAAVAAVLETSPENLDADVVDAIKRGARYIHLMPRSK
jgi:hypothetical protein